MNYLLSTLLLLLIGATLLITGILMNREPGQSLQSAFNDSVGWGLGFIVGFGTECWIFGLN